jgi:hypothetical protein
MKDKISLIKKRNVIYEKEKMRLWKDLFQNSEKGAPQYFC